jgi:hypothetical protein
MRPCESHEIRAPDAPAEHEWPSWAPWSEPGPDDFASSPEHRPWSQLPLWPSVISTASLRLCPPRVVILQLKLSRVITFRPGRGPQLSPSSPDGLVPLLDACKNLDARPSIVSTADEVLVGLRAADPARRIVFMFWLHFEERRILPRKLIVRATLNPRRRTVQLTHG